MTDLQTAELVKVSANAFLATKISFINAVSEVCENVGADVTQLADAIGYDDRIGRKFLGAGLGFGGGCLPKDIRAFMARAGEVGADQALTFLREVDAINMRRRQRVIDLAREELGSVIGRNITVLGAAFKPNSDDVRDSPALAVAGQLSLAGASVRVYDPQGMDNARKVFPPSTTPSASKTPCAARNWSSSPPNGKSSRKWTRSGRRSSSTSNCSSTDETSSTSPTGKTPAGKFKL